MLPAQASGIRAASLTCALLAAGFLADCRLTRDALPHIVNAGHAAFPGGLLTVVSYNMLHGFGNRLNDETLEERLLLLRDGILTAGADIVILQEASLAPGRHGNTAMSLTLFATPEQGPAGGWRLQFRLGNGQRRTSHTLFRGLSDLVPVRDPLRADYRVPGAGSLAPEHRIALAARIKTTVGDFAVIGTHLTNTDARRRGTLARTVQARELAVWAEAESPAIVGGDFNSSPGSPPILALVQAGAPDVRAAAGAEGTAKGPGLTALDGTVTDPKDTAEQRIDYLFLLGPGTAVESARPFLDHPFPRASGGLLWSSDHIGLLALIRVGSPP